MKAPRLLAENIGSLLMGRRQSQHDLAQWCHHTDVWLSAILAGKRGLRLTDLDRIAEFFGIAAYQLLQPGISPLTERRSGKDRRSGRDRRIGHAVRAMYDLASALPARREHAPPAVVAAPSESAAPLPPHLADLVTEFQERLSVALHRAGREAGDPGPSRPGRRRRARGVDRPNPADAGPKSVRKD